MKTIATLTLALLMSTLAFAESKPYVSCTIEQVKDGARDVIFETAEFKPSELPKDENSLRFINLPGGVTATFWSIMNVSLGLDVRNQPTVGSRFTYSIQAPNGSWATSTVTVDPRFFLEPGAMRFSAGDGTYFNLVCMMNVEE